MTSPASIRFLFAGMALALALGGAAAAQTAAVPAAPSLKATVTVSADIVTIGDLVENAGPVAAVPIFRAPDLGTTGAVATDRILDAIRPHQLIGIDTHGLSEVMVTRASRAITPRDISARVAQALSSQHGFGTARNVMVNFDGNVRTIEVDPNASGELQVTSLSYDPRTARFDITLDLPNGALRQPVRYTGTAIATVETLAVNRPIERGELIQGSDLTTLRRPQTEGSAALTDTKAVIGLAARHSLRPDQPLAAGDLMKPEIVARNDTVTIVYRVPGVTLTLRGEAKDAGALGDTISVVNVETKHVVQAVVSGPDRVSVGPVSSLLVDNGGALSE